jgi:hypothetical protein
MKRGMYVELHNGLRDFLEQLEQLERRASWMVLALKSVKPEDPDYMWVRDFIGVMEDALAVLDEAFGDFDAAYDYFEGKYREYLRREEEYSKWVREKHGFPRAGRLYGVMQRLLNVNRFF